MDSSDVAECQELSSFTSEDTSLKKQGMNGGSRLQS